MAKKQEKPKQTTWAANLVEMATKITHVNRAEREAKKNHVAKIPSCTIFMNGRKVVLNGN